MQFDKTTEAFIALQTRKIMHAMDNSMDVRESVIEILEDVWRMALTVGVQAGADSVKAGTFEKSVRALAARGA